MSSLLLRNARAGLGGPVRDVLIVGGLIAEPGTEPPPGTETVDVQGGTVLPGLWDTHVHAVQWAQTRRRVDLSGARSAREAVALMTAAPQESGLTVGFGFRDGLWPDAPDKALLESVAPGAALVLMSQDLHTVWLSPAALTLIGRGDHPTGVLREQECYAAVAALPRAPQEELDRWVAEAATAAATRGVVGIQDFEMADNVTDWSRRAQAHRLDVRVVCSIPRNRLEEAIGRGLRTGEKVPVPDGAGRGPRTGGPDGEGVPGRGPRTRQAAGPHDLLEVGPVKIFTDGSLNTKTAYCEIPYPGTSSRGSLEIAPEELRTLMALASAHGVHPAVHAIGDLAVAITLDAFEAVGCPGRIEHAQLVTPADLPRFARPGLVAGVQPAHAPDDREIADTYWKGHTHRAYPYAALAAAGATLEFGSDAPVAPLDPWDGIASAVTRTDDTRDPWHPEQSLTLEAALAASTRGRTLTPGSAADLLITPTDPSGLSPSKLRDMEVIGTLLAGRWTHRLL
ncbi:amidohydrolase family protein [Sphaerisporangium sp. B11E5]|uniref:amidohydrolase n=1 Tax=Sphaerisporangium sp. B11E5 TaxID=3153563 RepID=UPI00325CD81E